MSTENRLRTMFDLALFAVIVFLGVSHEESRKINRALTQEIFRLQSLASPAVADFRRPLAIKTITAKGGRP